MITTIIKSTFQHLVFPNNLYYRGITSQPQIALTFDDGPLPEFTPQVIDILKHYSIQATFFIVGNNILKHPEIYQKILESKHTVGNHSMHHRKFAHLQHKDKLNEIELCFKAMKEYGPLTTKLFRPPHGTFDYALIRSLAKKNIKTIYWNYDSLDYKFSHSEDIITRFNNHHLKKGDVLLFHDDTSITADALPELIEASLKKGFKFVSVNEWIK